MNGPRAGRKTHRDRGEQRVAEEGGVAEESKEERIRDGEDDHSVHLSGLNTHIEHGSATVMSY